MIIAYTDRDVGYLPLPNSVEITLTNIVAPVELTRTAFVMPMFEDGSFLLAMNQRRGIEIPGGHVEPGETLKQAAAREGEEEVGAIVTRLIPIGYLKMTSEGVVPPDWKYPHPVGYQQFYAGLITDVREYVANDECAEPFRCHDLNDRRITRKTISIFGEEARRRLL